MKNLINGTKQFLKKAGIKSENLKIPVLADFIIDEAEELIEAAEIKNEEERRQEIKDALCDIIAFAANVMYAEKITYEELEKYADAVVKSNNSKFDDNYDDALISLKVYDDINHANGEKWDAYDPMINQVEHDVFIIKDKITGKILKSHKFKEPKHFL